MDDIKSLSGYAFSLKSSNFSWGSKKKAIMAQSTVEAKYVVVIATTSQAI